MRHYAVTYGRIGTSTETKEDYIKVASAGGYVPPPPLGGVGNADDINNAIDAAGPGGTVVVGAGRYEGNVIADQEGVTITSASTVVIDGDVYVSAAGVTLKGLEILGFLIITTPEARDITLEDCVVTRGGYIGSGTYDRNPSVFIADDGWFYMFFVVSLNDVYRPDPDNPSTWLGCDEAPGINCDADPYSVWYAKVSPDWTTREVYNLAECSTGQRGMAAFQDDTGKIWVFVSGPGLNTIQYCTSDDGGATWTGPTATGFTGSHVDAFQASDGKIWVFYEDGGTGIEAIKSTDGGASWTQVTNIGPSPNDGIPKAMEANGKLWVVWCNWNVGGKAWYTTSTDGLTGNTWATPTLLVDVPGTTMCDPVLYQDSTGKFWLFYAPWDNITNSQWIEYMTSTDGGATWSAPTQFTTGGYGGTPWWDMWPEPIEYDGDIYLFYTSERYGSTSAERIDGNIWVEKVSP